MFRQAAGFKAQYQSLTLLVAADFDEWRILLQGPGVVVHGMRQFNEAKAKEHARLMADSYLVEQRHESPDPVTDLEWKPLDAGEWLNWRP
jgi:hypothetical protein